MINPFITPTDKRNVISYNDDAIMIELSEYKSMANLKTNHMDYKSQGNQRNYYWRTINVLLFSIPTVMDYYTQPVSQTKQQFYNLPDKIK